MVILQFNKLIRNKWVWGVFAVVVSAAFCFDDLFRSKGPERQSSSPLASLTVGYDQKLEKDCRDMMELFPENPMQRDRYVSSEELFKTYAAVAAFKEAEVRVSNKTLGQAIRDRYLASFNYDEAEYKARIRQGYNMDISRFEELLRKSLQLQQGVASYMALSTWVSPMELEQLSHDSSDKFTVKVAEFAQTKEEADAIKVDEEGLKTWFAENTDRLHLPLRLKLRYLTFSASNTNLTNRFTITPEEITARYEADKDELYTTTDTNDVKTVKPESEVSAEIAKKLLDEKFMEEFEQILSVQAGTENTEIMDNPTVARDSLIEKMAKEYALQSVVTPWVEAKASQNLVDGFARRATSFFPGAGDTSVLQNLDPASDNYFRYAVFRADRSNTLWLVEAVEVSAAHDATFEEAKELIAAPALKDAKQQAFDKAVAAIREKGIEAVLKAGKASEAITFTASDEKKPEIANVDQVVATALQLNQGEMSELVSTGACKGFVVVCEARTNGDLASLYSGEQQGLAQILQAREFALPAANQYSYFKMMIKRGEWMKANLKALGFTRELDSETVED